MSSFAGGLSAQLPRYAERIGRERRRAEAKRPVPEASHVDCPAGGEGRPVVAMQEPSMMPEHRHLEPTPKRSIVTDGDARPSSVATVSGLSFGVAGQISERARAAGDDIACETPVRWLVVVRRVVKRQ